MVWSEKLHLVSLLDLYVCPKPVVSEHVRQQLLRSPEVESIRSAIERKLKGEGSIDSLYSTWLSYSGISSSKNPSDLVSVIIRIIPQRALFDLMLGQRVKSFQLSCYSEVHEARALIVEFFAEYQTLMCPTPDLQRLWWDEIDPDRTSHTPWLSGVPRTDTDFLDVFDSWLGDSDHLQNWLDGFEAETKIVNNPRDRYPVFSEKNAIGTMDFAKVRYLSEFLPRVHELTLGLFSFRDAFWMDAEEKPSMQNRAGLLKNAMNLACSRQE